MREVALFLLGAVSAYTIIVVANAFKAVAQEKTMRKILEKSRYKR